MGRKLWFDWKSEIAMATEAPVNEPLLKVKLVSSLPEDKPKIVFHAVMMAIQNFGFFVMYFMLYVMTPYTTDKSIPYYHCASSSAAFGTMAITCFFVTWLCIGMGFGGYTDDALVFGLYWYAHLIGGSMYTGCTLTVPWAIYSDDGEECFEHAELVGKISHAVFSAHAGLYMVYVGGMLSITWFSFLKNCLKAKKVPHPVLMVLVPLLFFGPQGFYIATM